MLYIHGLIHLEQAHDADWASTWCGNVNVTHTWYNGQEDGPLWAYGHMHNTWHWHLETTVIDDIDKYIKENKGATTPEAYTFLRRPDLLLWIHWLQQLWECARDAATRFNTLLSATAPGPPRRPDYTQWIHETKYFVWHFHATLACIHLCFWHRNRCLPLTIPRGQWWHKHTSYDTTGTVTETVVRHTYILLTIPREQSQRQWWHERNDFNLIYDLLRYHGDSGEMNETFRLGTTRYTLMTTILENNWEGIVSTFTGKTTFGQWKTKAYT